MAVSQMQASGTPVDVAQFIEQQPVGGFQIRLLLTCAAVLFLDGFDTQAIGYVAPALAKEWGLTKAALGPVFSAGLFGLMIGALVFGPLADRVGRKKIIVFSTLAFGIGTLATVFIQDVGTLLAIRFLTGLGLGGAMPNAVAMTSEFSPHRRRATMVMIMFCGFSVGAALGGRPLASGVSDLHGWRRSRGKLGLGTPDGRGGRRDRIAGFRRADVSFAAARPVAAHAARGGPRRGCRSARRPRGPTVTDRPQRAIGGRDRVSR